MKSCLHMLPAILLAAFTIGCIEDAADQMGDMTEISIKLNQESDMAAKASGNFLFENGIRSWICLVLDMDSGVLLKKFKSSGSSVSAYVRRGAWDNVEIIAVANPTSWMENQYGSFGTGTCESEIMEGWPISMSEWLEAGTLNSSYIPMFYMEAVKIENSPVQNITLNLDRAFAKIQVRKISLDASCGSGVQLYLNNMFLVNATPEITLDNLVNGTSSCYESTIDRVEWSNPPYCYYGNPIYQTYYPYASDERYLACEELPGDRNNLYGCSIARTIVSSGCVDWSDSQSCPTFYTLPASRILNPIEDTGDNEPVKGTMLVLECRYTDNTQGTTDDCYYSIPVNADGDSATRYNTCYTMDITIVGPGTARPCEERKGVSVIASVAEWSRKTITETL